MKIKVEIKNIYGNKLIYPVCDKSKLLCKIMDSKTLLWHKIDYLKELGYEIETIASNGGVL